MKTKNQFKVKQQILNTIPIFLAKTYKIVDNPQYSDIISWTQDGQGFIVKDINRLTTEIFPKHFKHSNFASFVRQLNMYGFHKIKSQEQGHAFTHQCFQKNEIEKLQDIKRRSGVSTEVQANETNMMVPLRTNRESQFEKEINNIKNKHDDLQSFVSMLVDQNKEILMQNRSFVNKMSKMQQKYRNKLQTLMLLLLFGKAKNSNGQPFILPQQFQNMLQTFGDGNSNINSNGNNNTNGNPFQVNDQGMRRKKQKKQAIMMLKNQSEAEIQRKHIKPQQGPIQQHDEIEKLISEIDGGDKREEKPRDDLDESIDLVMPSPNHSYISFPELYEKESAHDVSDFLDRMHHNDDYEEDMGGMH